MPGLLSSLWNCQLECVEREREGGRKGVKWKELGVDPREGKRQA
jgi:hypothetical protein